MELTLSVIFKKELEGGYSAFCPELGVASQGETIEEAEANIREACELYVESARDVGILDKVLEDIDVENKEIVPVLAGSIRAEVKI